jgi:hypothetical protein
MVDANGKYWHIDENNVIIPGKLEQTIDRRKQFSIKKYIDTGRALPAK